MRKTELVKAVTDLVDFVQGSLNEVNAEILNTSPMLKSARYEELKVQRAVYSTILQRMYDNGLIFADDHIKKEYV